MPSSPSQPRRGTRAAFAAALLVACGLAACGRRGPLEPPVDPSAAAPAGKGVAAEARVRPGAARRQTTAPSTALTTRQGSVVADSPDNPDEEDEEDATQAVNPIPTPRKRVRAYAVPKEPFILDPLL